MKISCSGCSNTWSAKTWAHCSVCHATFTGVGYFDAHRTAEGCWGGWEMIPVPEEGSPSTEGAPPRKCAIPPRRKGLPPPSWKTYLWCEDEDHVWSTREGHQRLRQMRNDNISKREYEAGVDS